MVVCCSEYEDSASLALHYSPCQTNRFALWSQLIRRTAVTITLSFRAGKQQELGLLEFCVSEEYIDKS